jgi:hypothetical protein
MLFRQVAVGATMVADKLVFICVIDIDLSTKIIDGRLCFGDTQQPIGFWLKRRKACFFLFK